MCIANKCARTCIMRMIGDWGFATLCLCLNSDPLHSTLILTSLTPFWYKLWRKHVLPPRPSIQISGFGMLRSTFMFVLALLAFGHVAAAAESSIQSTDEPDYWQGPVWQDLQLLFSFLTGILFVRSAETVFDNGNGGNIRLSKLELYPLLA